MSEAFNPGGGSNIKESLASWSDLAGLLRGGDQGAIVPVVIPKDNRGLRWMVLCGSVYPRSCQPHRDHIRAVSDLVVDAIYGALAVPTLLVGLLSIGAAILWWWRASIIEIEEGTTGILTKYGAFVKNIGPGRHYLWHPWARVDFVVDTRTEIPVHGSGPGFCPTRENVPLKSIEFFLKFRIDEPYAFVTTIGAASNFGLSALQRGRDAIRQRSQRSPPSPPTTCAAPMWRICVVCSTSSCASTGCHHRLQHPRRAAAQPVPAAPGDPGTGGQGTGRL